jgi:hypothetical protein
MAGLDISPTKVGFIIIKAREYDGKVAAWDDSKTSDHDAESILENFSDDATRTELKTFIADLNEDEQASLVALAWIGRGSYGPDELDEALETARAERVNPTEDYLLGIPMLADYLEEGLDRLGYSVEDAEDNALGG